jgi:hypothetical protein
MVGGSLRLPPPLKLSPWYSWNITQSGVKHNKTNKPIPRYIMSVWIRNLNLPNLSIYLKVCPGDVVNRLPEPITPRKRQNSIAVFLCTIHFLTIWLQNLNHVSLNRKQLPCTVSTAPSCRQNNWWSCRYNIQGIPGIRGFQERSCQMANPLGHYKM